MSSFTVDGMTIQSGYYRSKLPSTNKAHGFTHDERLNAGMRGLYPGGVPLTLEQKVEVRSYTGSLHFYSFTYAHLLSSYLSAC